MFSENQAGWLNLWQAAKLIAPKMCGLASWWVSNPTASPGAVERAEAALMRRDPSIINAATRIRTNLRPGDDVQAALATLWAEPRFLVLLRAEMAQRADRRQRLGRHLMRCVLPFKLRQALVSGAFEVSARLHDGRTTTLAPRDLVGLDVDLANSSLAGDGLVYGAVRVRRHTVDASADAPAASEGEMAKAWMIAYCNVKDGAPLRKRDSAIQECMDATRCTWREALAAWNAVPSKFKRASRQNDRAVSEQ
ncbi:MAG: hypothetical protein P4L66_08155 [Acetobacteraceae bacterium]|nr:hypothetical protein [Acetobacteraceae bacterium]